MNKTSPAKILLAFLVIAVPLGWGFYRSVKNSVPLFTGGPVAVQAPVTK